jgi:hypothetical protein
VEDSTVLSGAGAIGVAFALPKSSNDAPITSPNNLILVIGISSFMLDTIFINTRPSPDRFDADQMCRLLISGSDERSGTLWLTLGQIANRCTDHAASSRVSCLAAERAGSIGFAQTTPT